LNLGLRRVKEGERIQKKVKCGETESVELLEYSCSPATKHA
jgi:hypothetical protein